MAKNIVIFSDGTGQGGGLLPDEHRSNVYKLFRAARVCPDSTIDPAKQLAFYDPGLGSQAAASGIKIGWWRWIYNLLSKATGLGYTQNIIDCYAAILRVWEKDDRIYLVGFSRGAYTVRCVANVLNLCGVPTQGPCGQPLKRDEASAHAIATEAVKQVYQFGSSRKGDPLRKFRMELAARFRKQYASGAPDDPTLSNAFPYFIGVWDTVAALGLTTGKVLGLGFAAVILVSLLAGLCKLLIGWTGDVVNEAVFWPAFWRLWQLAAIGALISYLYTHVKFATGLSVPWYKTLHVTGWRMKFYDTDLNPNVQHARHALSIDENRKDFDRVPWTDKGLVVTEQRKAGAGYIRLIQMWFAGVHSDVGGSYAETEARLSDISLGWMIDQAANLPEPMELDLSGLHLWPGAAGPQHDERKSTVAGFPGWVRRVIRDLSIEEQINWTPWVRAIPDDAPLHPTVLERFAVQPPGVLHYDVTELYRPEALRSHNETRQFYPPPASSAGV